MQNTVLFTKITTDAFLFEMEPGNASRTKFAVALASDLSKLDLDLLTPEQVEQVQSIKKRITEFLV